MFYEINLTPTAAAELNYFYGEFSTVHVAEMAFGPLWATGYAPGKYVLRREGVMELQSWSSFELGSIADRGDRSEVGKASALRALYRQTVALIGRHHEVG
jgi:hypothetical protein